MQYFKKTQKIVDYTKINETTDYTFNYKGYGFKIDEDTLKLENLENTVDVHEIITSVENKEPNENYIISNAVKTVGTENYFYNCNYICNV